jgi:cell shape-determining protein MreC
MERVNFISAHITGSDTGNVSHVKILDQGSSQQVSAGQIALGVIDAEGAGKSGDADNSVPDIYQMAVVGRISDTALGNSRLQLITDARFQVPVEIRPRWNRQQNWQVKGIMKGRGTWDMTVGLVSANYPVMVGDPVLIRAGTDTLPETMLIGFVSECKRDDKNAVLWQISVEPAVDLNNLRKVIIAASK